jgi:hypothetical protein
MRSTVTSALCLSVFLTAAPFVYAQRAASTFNGIWREMEIRVERPDTAYTRPGWNGVSIILNGHFSQIWLPPGQPGVQQQGAALTTAEQKAARYDSITANAGVLEVKDDSTFAGHYEQAKNPAAIGRTFTVHYRLRGDTLWQIGTAPWSKDSSKTVRTTHKYVRMK